MTSEKSSHQAEALSKDDYTTLFYKNINYILYNIYDKIVLKGVKIGDVFYHGGDPFHHMNIEYPDGKVKSFEPCGQYYHDECHYRDDRKWPKNRPSADREHYVYDIDFSVDDFKEIAESNKFECDKGGKELNITDDFIAKTVSLLKDPKNKIPLPDGMKKIVLHNLCGNNNDHRGSDHCIAKLAFKSKLTLIEPTVDDFIRGLIYVRSHKFENWYELYASSTAKYILTKVISINEDVSLEEEGLVKIEITFDHGS